jgi:hypothetical protein
VNWVRKVEEWDLERPRRWLVAAVIVIILIILAGWGLLGYEQLTEQRAREAVLGALNDLSSDAVVTIEGEARPIGPVLLALKELKHVESHHSYPIGPLRIEIRDGNKTIELVVAQDSERSDEYWVYRPGANYHNDPLGESLGRIETQVFH